MRDVAMHFYAASKNPKEEGLDSRPAYNRPSLKTRHEQALVCSTDFSFGGDVMKKRRKAKQRETTTRSSTATTGVMAWQDDPLSKMPAHCPAGAEPE